MTEMINLIGDSRMQSRSVGRANGEFRRCQNHCEVFRAVLNSAMMSISLLWRRSEIWNAEVDLTVVTIHPSEDVFLNSFNPHYRKDPTAFLFSEQSQWHIDVGDGLVVCA